MSQPITRTMSLQEVLHLYPSLGKVLAGFNLHCVGCGGAKHDTVEKGAVNHGLDVDELLEALNAAIGK